MTVDLDSLLGGLAERTREKFQAMPNVLLKDDTFDIAKLPVDKAEWHRLSDVVAVVADLKSSTKLDERRYAQSTASIYDAGVGGVVRIFSDLNSDFVDIQGDGGFALFWGEKRYERALCVGISIRTFSANFKKQLEKKWPKAPTTGFKVGIASGSVLAKRVGLAKHLDMQEPVWAGKPVNYAAKAAQQTEPNELLITGSVWDRIQSNDYLTATCGCVDGVPGHPPSSLWTEIELEKIPNEERFGQKLSSIWCETHGNEYCQAILDGKTSRSDLNQDLRKSFQSISASASQEERQRAAAARGKNYVDVLEELKQMRLERARRQ